MQVKIFYLFSDLIIKMILIKSNITPTEREITVKAEIANNIGGIICPNNHLSINGMEYQGVIIFLIVFLISD